jgi:hypothetical protein
MARASRRTSRGAGSRGSGPRGGHGKPGTGFTPQGFEEFKAALNEVANEIPSIVSRTDMELGEETIRRAKRRAQQIGGVAPKAMRSARVERKYGNVKVKYGGTQWPYAMGAEFGSHHYNQFKSYRRAGYFFFQSRYEVEHYDLERTYYEAFSRAMRHTFPD